MEKKPLLKRILAVSLAVAVTVNGLTFSALADDSGAVDFREVSTNSVSVKPSAEKKLDTESGAPSYLDTDVVRVSIVLKDKSTIENTVEMGYDIENIAENSAAMSYRSELQDKQTNVVNEIENVIEEDLDVVWNLTLAANIISANVEYGQIEDIEALEEVEEVLIETQYYPDVLKDTLPLDPNMATSSLQIGSQNAWDSGCTGAGSRIAVIDTGTDDDHQSFSEAGYLHSLEALAEAEGMSFKDYAESLNLLTWEEIDSVKDKLNAGTAYNGQSSVMPITQQAYLNTKLPFAYNYVDSDYEINHDNDKQGEHGSHVAGIATANKYIKTADGFVKALEYPMALTQGVAPDAQLITMKVFGKGGGAYDSDYMVAIEDAIVLKADAINLSLGSGNPGASKSSTKKYQEIFDNLTKSGVVVSISAGNAGYWAANSETGLLYSDDVSMQTDGSPGSFTNALTVASVDNEGTTGRYIQVGDERIFYNESPDTYDSLVTLAGKPVEYVFIDGFGTEEDWAALGDSIKGKIAVCSRGEISFVEKGNYAVEHGAIATIVYNNAPGTINMSADGYNYTNPYVSVTQEAGAILKAHAVANGTPVTAATPAGENTPADESAPEDENLPEVSAETNEADNADETSAASEENTETEGTESAPEESAEANTEATADAPKETAGEAPLGYIGAMEISKGFTTDMPETVTPIQTMSDFSSWGMPGTLELKPEITAPGGNIYSVNGLVPGGTEYENMSGTSMAAPQIAGMAALAAQYVRESNLAEKTGLTPRVLIQSLLMSTATPLYGIDEGELYTYSVFQQGAGLANINDLINADSYILMESDATDSYKDGKIKVELGDDPDMKGEYSFGFTVNNLSDTDKDYALYTDMFTQAPIYDKSYNSYMYTSTMPLDYSVQYIVNGTPVEEEGVITVPASGSVKVTANVKLDPSYAEMVLSVFDKGFYVEGYTYVEGVTDAEGNAGTVHSIPILGFYGNWTDPSMFDVGSYIEYISGEEYRMPYLGDITENVFGVEYANEPGSTYILGGNPIIEDETYMEDRNAINGGDTVSAIIFTAIRNAANSMASVINESDPEKSLAMEAGSVDAAFYYDNGGEWRNTTNTLNLGFSPSAFGYKEGEKFTVRFTLAPEYYVEEGEKGTVTAWDKLGEGASFEIPLTVDNTNPQITKISLDEENKVLKVTVQDNRYVAGVILYNKTGDALIASVGSNPDATAGEAGEFLIPVDGIKGTEFLIRAYDYANNMSTYRFNEEIGENLPAPDKLALNYNSKQDVTGWININTANQESPLSVYAQAPKNFVSATIADHFIFAADENNDLYVMPEDDIYTYVRITNLGTAIDDMAFNPQDKQIYGVTGYNTLVRIDKLTGEVTEIASIPDTVTLACDKDGIFYCNNYGTGIVFAFTLDDLDPVALFDISELGIGVSSGAQAMEIDPNTNNLCWTSFTTVKTDKGNQNTANYLEFAIDLDLVNMTLDFDLVDATFTGTRLFGLVITDKTPAKNYDFNGDGEVNAADGQALLDYRTGAITEIFNAENIDVDGDGDFDSHDAYVLLSTILWAKPTRSVYGVNISSASAVLVPNGTFKLEADITPWTASNREIVWTSSDTSVATVDANGIVTAHKAGECVITASAAADRSVYAECGILVENIESTLFGALQDEEGNPTFYEWNVETDDTWKGTTAINRLGGEIVSAAADESGNVYICDSESTMHKIDPSTGTDIASSGILLPLTDMAYSYVESTPDMPLFAAVYEGWLLAPDDPMNISGSGFNLTSYVANYGGSKFIALTSGGASQVETEDGLVSGEQLVAIDNAGNLWDFLLTDTTIYWNTYRSVLPVGFLGGNTKGEYCSLAYGADGYLYLSVFDGNTANYYRIALNDENAMASYFGNVGDGVWPSTIISAASNAHAAAAYANNIKVMAESASISEFDASEGFDAEAAEEIAFDEELSEMNILSSASVIGEKLEKVIDVPETAALFLEDGTAFAADVSGETAVDETVSDATITNRNIDLQLKAQENKAPVESTNGLFVVKYNPDAFMFTGTGDNAEIYGSYSVDEEKGLLIVAYASPSYIIPEDKPAQTANFIVVNASLASESSFEVTFVEKDSDNKLEAVPKTDENGNIVRDENGAIVYDNPPITVDVSTVTEQLDSVVKALIEEYPELEEAIKSEYAPENVIISAGIPVDPDPTPEYPSGGGFTDPTDTVTESAETTASSEAPVSSADNTAEPDSTTDDNTNSTADPEASEGDPANTTTDGSSENTGSTDDSGNTDNTGNTGDTSNVGDDKNINTGALLFIAPAAVSALAVLVSKKRGK